MFRKIGRTVFLRLAHSIFAIIAGALMVAASSQPDPNLHSMEGAGIFVCLLLTTFAAAVQK